jgi:hypothetical protein
MKLSIVAERPTEEKYSTKPTFIEIQAINGRPPVKRALTFHYDRGRARGLLHTLPSIYPCTLGIMFLGP